MSITVLYLPKTNFWLRPWLAIVGLRGYTVTVSCLHSTNYTLCQLIVDRQTTGSSYSSDMAAAQSGSSCGTSYVAEPLFTTARDVAW